MNDIMKKLHGVDIYKDFVVIDTDITGGGNFNVLLDVIEQLKPQTVIEVGSWKGKSAIFMARAMKDNGIKNPAVICVDTWLGSFEHYTSYKTDPVWGIDKYMHNGRPMLYEQFISNVLTALLQDVIVPVALPSNIAYKLLKYHNITAKLIFIDGDHSEDECYSDIAMYWDLLEPGGIMIGDDFTTGWYTVICAVSKFARERGLSIYAADDKWILQKAV